MKLQTAFHSGETSVEWITLDLAASGWSRAELTADDIAEGERRAKDLDFMASRACTRRVLGAALGRAPLTIEIARAENGRLGLVYPVFGGRFVDFNLSHAKGQWALALLRSPNPDARIGIDIERFAALEKPVPALKLGKRFFSEGEVTWLEWLAARSEAAAQEGFFRLWTLREAIVKATGQGMWRSFETLELKIAKPFSGPGDSIGAPEELRVWELAAPAGFKMTCVGLGI